jgi:hypothetical protein
MSTLASKKAQKFGCLPYWQNQSHKVMQAGLVQWLRTKYLLPCNCMWSVKEEQAFLHSEVTVFRCRGSYHFKWMLVMIDDLGYLE